MATRAVYSRIFVHCTHENRGEGESRGEEGEEREWGGNDRVIRVSGDPQGIKSVITQRQNCQHHDMQLSEIYLEDE